MRTLLRRRDELQALLARFDVAAEPLKGSSCSPSDRRRLRDIRQGEARAIEALDRLEWIIADTAAEAVEDLALKVQLYPELGAMAKRQARGEHRLRCKSTCFERSSRI